MAASHEAIVKKVIKLWTSSGRGRLFPYTVGKFRALQSERVTKIGVTGHPDLCGFCFSRGSMASSAACYVEVKTKAYSKLSKEQQRFMCMATAAGCECYVAMEDSSVLAGFKLTRWTAVKCVS